jgi:nucleoside-diphosphate-sugar epimerase
VACGGICVSGTGGCKGRWPLRIAACAIRRIQPHRFEREAVRVDDAVTLLREKWILRRHAIEFFERETAWRVGELPRRPAALHHDPVTGLETCRLHSEDPQRFTPGALRVLEQHRKADITKAKTELGYQPTSIEDAVREAYHFNGLRGAIQGYQPNR